MRKAKGTKQKDRRRSPRREASPAGEASSTAPKDKSKRSKNVLLSPQGATERCVQCNQELGFLQEGHEPGEPPKLGTLPAAMFVEEDVGRVFCSEGCIGTFFSDEIDRLEKEYLKRSNGIQDLSTQEKEDLNHLRWVTLQEPDEVYRIKTVEGDYRYTLISEFIPKNKKIHCVVQSLFLRGEPSFLFLSFVTENGRLVQQYRKGEKVLRPVAEEPGAEAAAAEGVEGEETSEEHADRLAAPWTKEETLRAQTSLERNADDIPQETYGFYQEQFMERSLDEPDEVWTNIEAGEKNYHFIKRFSDVEGAGGEAESFWYLILAKEAEENEDQIELLDAFPTRDPHLVERYRVGNQEVGEKSAKSAGRTIH